MENLIEKTEPVVTEKCVTVTEKNNIMSNIANFLTPKNPREGSKIKEHSSDSDPPR